MDGKDFGVVAVRVVVVVVVVVDIDVEAVGPARRGEVCLVQWYDVPQEPASVRVSVYPPTYLPGHGARTSNRDPIDGSHSHDQWG